MVKSKAQFTKDNCKNWPYRLLISSNSLCQLCCNRILVSRLHKTQRQRSLMVPLRLILLLSIQLWNSCLLTECDKSVSQLLGAKEFVSYTRAGGRGQCPNSFLCASEQGRRNVSCAGWPAVEDGGKTWSVHVCKDRLLCRSAEPVSPGRGFHFIGSNLERSQCNVKLIQTDGQGLSLCQWLLPQRQIRNQNSYELLAPPQDYQCLLNIFKAALMFYASHGTLVLGIVHPQQCYYN